jgi:hypothetical protein
MFLVAAQPENRRLICVQKAGDFAQNSAEQIKGLRWSAKRV